MGAFAELLEQQIEDEINRRLDVYVSKLAKHFFTTEREIYKALQKDEAVQTKCRSHAKNGKPCKNRGKYDGYCHLHKRAEQKPKHVNSVSRMYESFGDSSTVLDELF